MHPQRNLIEAAMDCVLNEIGLPSKRPDPGTPEGVPYDIKFHAAEFQSYLDWAKPKTAAQRQENHKDFHPMDYHARQAVGDIIGHELEQKGPVNRDHHGPMIDDHFNQYLETMKTNIAGVEKYVKNPVHHKDQFTQTVNDYYNSSM